MSILPIDQIRRDGGTQSRAALDDATVADYAEAMTGGATFPPVVVYHDGADYWLVDGFHRVAAAELAGQQQIAADVRQGSLQEAQWHSYGVNATHGLRRSNADKRRAVEAALRHPYAQTHSNTQLAQHCGVNEKTIRNYLATSEIPRSDRRTGVDGRTINTANIGKAAPAFEPGDLVIHTISGGLYMISHQISTTRYEIHPRCDDTQRSRQVDASILRRPTEQEIAWRGTRPPDLPAPPPELEPEDEAPEAPDAFYAFWSTHTGPAPDLPLELWRLVWLDGYIYQGETPGGGLLFVHESGSVLETSYPDLCDRYSWEPEPDPEPIPFPTPRITLSETQRIRDALEDQGWIVASHDRGYQLTRGDQSFTVADEAGLIGVLETGAPDGGYDRDEWYTPQRVITHAWDTMGGIDLDPASNEEAQEVVQAATYYTKADNGLAQPWHGRVWLNPPYSQPAPWADKTIAAWEAGTIEQAILLVNDQTDAQWYQRLLSAASVVCFLGQRVRFWHPERRGETPRQGQTVFYFGDRADRFVAIFRPLGVLMVGYPEAIEASIELAPPERVERGG